MTRHPNARTVAFADDGFVNDTLQSALHIWAELRHAFKEDDDVMMQLTKCTLLVQGVASLQEARQKVRECMDADPALHSLREIFDKEKGKDVIQVEGIKRVGVPIGTPEFVHNFVADKASKILADVEKVQVVSDPLIHFHLLFFCQNTLFGYLSRNVPISVMVNARRQFARAHCHRRVKLCQCARQKPRAYLPR